MSCFRIPVDIEARRLWKSVQRLSGENVWTHLPFCLSTQACSVLRDYLQPWAELRVAGSALTTVFLFQELYMKFTLDPKTVALWSCFKKMLIFSSFSKSSFFKTGEAGPPDTTFIEDAVLELLKTRRILKCSYPYGFFLEPKSTKKEIYELMQVSFYKKRDIPL